VFYAENMTTVYCRSPDTLVIPKLKFFGVNTEPEMADVVAIVDNDDGCQK
jgi:hypothetical protein